MKRMRVPTVPKQGELLQVWIPTALKERLEIAAARKKRSLGLRRASMGPIVAEALDRYLNPDEPGEERE